MLGGDALYLLDRKGYWRGVGGYEKDVVNLLPCYQGEGEHVNWKEEWVGLEEVLDLGV